MDTVAVRLWLETKAEFSSSRSSGPGGQNVNKVNSKVMLRIPIAAVEGVSDGERLRLFTQLAGKLTETGDLVIQVQDERSQLLNRDLAVERALELITRALHRDKPRRKTKPTRASKERRLTAKKSASTRKAQRTRPDFD